MTRYTICAAVGSQVSLHHVDAFDLVSAIRVVRAIVGRQPYLFPTF